jgi:hypothetical protein
MGMENDFLLVQGCRANKYDKLNTFKNATLKMAEQRANFAITPLVSPI